MNADDIGRRIEHAAELRGACLFWRKLTSDPDPVWSGEREGTQYWIQCDPVTNRWSVMDSHGAVWGGFENHEQAMREVEEMK